MLTQPGLIRTRRSSAISHTVALTALTALLLLPGCGGSSTDPVDRTISASRTYGPVDLTIVTTSVLQRGRSQLFRFKIETLVPDGVTFAYTGCAPYRVYIQKDDTVVGEALPPSTVPCSETEQEDGDSSSSTSVRTATWNPPLTLSPGHYQIRSRFTGRLRAVPGFTLPVDNHERDLPPLQITVK